MVRYNRHYFQQRLCENSVNCVLFTFVLALFPMPFVQRSPIVVCNAHLIQQGVQYHDYRSNGYSGPHMSPRLPELVDQLPSHGKARDLTPLECMVDLTNELSFRILHYHSILNRNNFAFSPTALMSVLVALYEGSTGRSSSELKNVLHLPNNRDIVRVGYRDIHRRLRTYFFNTENPLEGLRLHKDNVTITRDYEAILKFYGYDLVSDMVSSIAAPTLTTSSSLTTPTTHTDEGTTPYDPTIEAGSDTPKETPTGVLEETPTTILAATALPETTATVEKLTTAASLETTIKTTVDVPTDTDIEPKTTTILSTNEEDATTTFLPDQTTGGDTTEMTIATVAENDSPMNEAAELISSFVAGANSGPLSRFQKQRRTRLPSAKSQAPLEAKHPPVKYLPSPRNSKRLTTNRSKRHLLGIKPFDYSLFASLFRDDALLLPTSVGAYNTHLNAHFPVPDEFEVYTEPNFISSASAAIKEKINADVITHIFYLSNQQIIYTSFKVYNAVLYYKYFEQMRMSVLELELDTPEYNLIILLPDYTTDLVAATAALRSGPKLRTMRKQLKPKWVQAIIPDFKLHGTMFLTNDLQNLGICDIFEPNRADFRPMTDEQGAYVKHIEQSINIHIRTHPINQIRLNNGPHAQPAQISVNHPFMFFIIDRDLDVAVMSGRILNPLNVRIQ